MYYVIKIYRLLLVYLKDLNAAPKEGFSCNQKQKSKIREILNTSLVKFERKFIFVGNTIFQHIEVLLNVE